MPTRNLVVRHGAILRKGGVHTESVSGKRHQSKRALDDEIDDYFEMRNESNSDTQKESKPEVSKEQEAGKPASSSLAIHTYIKDKLAIRSPQLLQFQR